jgi:phenylacetate-coenzyme A ligase PaaK-like adenylate-forming protein
VVLEVLEPDDRPAAPGRVGEIVGTNLHAFGVPLIRVRTGDHASLARDCGCGGTHGTIDNLVRGTPRDQRSRPQTEAGGESPRVA